VKKTDVPGPGQYKDFDKAFNLTTHCSPTTHFKKGKRIIFAEETALSKKFMPSPDQY
jgi:hypothetical protein